MQRKIKWCTTDALHELVSKLEAYANSQIDFNPGNIEYLYSVYGGDHGVGNFRFVLKLVAKMKNDNKIYTVISLLAVVDQLRKIPGGIALLMKYWIEHYH
jgi:hypothetical protein